MDPGIHVINLLLFSDNIMRDHYLAIYQNHLCKFYYFKSLTSVKNKNRIIGVTMVLRIDAYFDKFRKNMAD
jgi:hypothetical protein